MFSHKTEGYVCPFCVFIQRGNNSLNDQQDVVYQDSLVTAFIAPMWWTNNEGHVIIIPNRHFENLFDLPPLYAHRIQDIAKEIAIAFKQVYLCHGVSTRQHNEPAGNQDVWHYHLHVFPRYEGDNLYQSSRSREPASVEKRHDYAKKLKAVLAVPGTSETAEMPHLSLVLMTGLPGTGKTTLALALGRTLGWPVIDKDSLKSPMLISGIKEELAGPASYALMLEMAGDLLVRQHLSVILDSPGRFPFVLDRVKEMSREVGATLKIIQCIASRELRNKRLIERIARPSQWTANASMTDEQERQMFAHLPAGTLIIDTGCPFEQCLAQALAHLEYRQH